MTPFDSHFAIHVCIFFLLSSCYQLLTKRANSTCDHETFKYIIRIQINKCIIVCDLHVTVTIKPKMHVFSCIGVHVVLIFKSNLTETVTINWTYLHVFVLQESTVLCMLRGKTEFPLQENYSHEIVMWAGIVFNQRDFYFFLYLREEDFDFIKQLYWNILSKFPWNFPVYSIVLIVYSFK